MIAATTKRHDRLQLTHSMLRLRLSAGLTIVVVVLYYGAASLPLPPNCQFLPRCFDV